MDTGEEHLEHIMDIFSESKMYKLPNTDNIFKLCQEAANYVLIKQPFFCN